MKTKLQIYRSAEKAAEDSLGIKLRHEASLFAHRRFEEETLDPRDWDFWIQTYDQCRQTFEQFATAKSFSKIVTQPTQ